MGTDTKDIFSKASKLPSATEVFARDLPRDVSARDVFVGDDNLYKIIDDAKGPSLLSQAATTAARTGSRLFTATHVILMLNIVVISGILAWVVLRNPTAAPSEPSASPADPAAAAPLPTVELSRPTMEALDKAVSWQTAEQLFHANDYYRAYYVYQRLFENLTAAIPADEFMRDFLQLKMALCLKYAQDQTELTALFTAALQSRSPVVRALANYHLMFLEMQANDYLAARAHAYKTLALLESIRDAFPPALESNCYFVLAEAITRQSLLLANEPLDLPGKLWTHNLQPDPLPGMDQDQLKAFLQTGVFDLSEGVLSPRIAQRPSLTVGSRWSALCMDIPLEEVLARFASEADLNLDWQSHARRSRRAATTLYLTAASEQLVPEIAAGSAGLIAQLTPDGIHLVSPDVYDNLEDHKDRIAREALTVWRRFLLRYRGDHRTANAHYAMGLLHERIGQDAAALGEYKLLAGQHPHNPLAPYALLNSSRIRTGMHDYRGAKSDLSELIIQYPDFKMVDQASLHLAEATMQTGVYDEAMRIFHKIHNLNLSSDSQQRAAYGMGHCAFELGDYDAASKWLTHAINLTDNSADPRLGPAYVRLGESLIQRKQYPKASLALRSALGLSLSTDEYVQVLLQLVDAEIRQENYVVALNMLERMPAAQLSQDQSCHVTIRRAEILRQIDLVSTATSLLRRKIEFIADSRLRALLTLELARCYTASGDWRVAEQKLSEALISLPPGPRFRQAQLLLVETYINLEDYSQARGLCLQFLHTEDLPDAERKAGLDLLGRVYTHLNDHDKAALAYAGIYEGAQ